jgi:hypothetical protein
MQVGCLASREHQEQSIGDDLMPEVIRVQRPWREFAADVSHDRQAGALEPL